ncbi:MAG: amidohydrolase [Clostridia bacterium]|nr:amidohydrolase [Clostridia bacterium]
MEAKNRILQILEAKKQQIFDLSDLVWDLAEIRFACVQSARALADLLAGEGFSIEWEPGGVPSAFVARAGHGSPCIGVLAEYDALAGMNQVADVTEKQASAPEAGGHGCGHNAIGAGVVAGAIAIAAYLKEQRAEGSVVLFGCPAEEEGYGKAFLARAGVFNSADALLTWHPTATTGVWGQSTLAVNQLYFSFKGVSAHAGANPELGRSALDAAELMNVGVQFLREHVSDATRIHYAFRDVGGGAANVVQPTAKLHYIVRARTQAEAVAVTERVIKVARGAALMTETEVEVVWDAAAAEYIVNRTLGDAMYANLQAVTPIPYEESDYTYMAPFRNSLPAMVTATQERSFREAFPEADAAEVKRFVSSPIADRLFPKTYSDQPMTGSTDVADASWVRPTGQITVAYGPNGSNPHSWQWVATGKSNVAHRAILTAGQVIALTALDLISDPDLLVQAKAEHTRNLGGRVYRSAMPEGLLPR